MMQSKIRSALQGLDISTLTAGQVLEAVRRQVPAASPGTVISELRALAAEDLIEADSLERFGTARLRD
jgi:Fe2+ or Zn2+ uptake regulation protein